MKPINVDFSDYHKTVEMFHNETDRSAAILAGSYIDNFLVKLLRAFMINDKKIDEWFDGFGPFSTYAQRVTCAYAFNLITKLQKRDLDFIGKIRNHFAHHPFDSSFDESPVSNWILHLSSNEASKVSKIQLTNKDKYLLAIGTNIGMMQGKIVISGKA